MLAVHAIELRAGEGGSRASPDEKLKGNKAICGTLLLEHIVLCLL